ncbi:MAG: anaerobic sulfite reductase subunit AsrB, partial [Thermoanaerobacteraceae bacterium]|nr:anaerobic sulfite reductase subunit AsrB [Thermoanaerobacteraceae bacterium]
LKVITGFKSPADILFFDDIARWKKNSSQFILTVDSGAADFECYTGFVTEHIPKLKCDDVSKAVAIVVGPPPMMHFSTLELLKMGFLEENIWISLERKMCCGIGKCGHCKINDVYVCIDGPVFNYAKAKTLID